MGNKKKDLATLFLKQMLFESFMKQVPHFQ